jgi:thioredoxin reductase (NADPH)
MIQPAIVIVDAFPQVLQKLENDLGKKYSDHFRIIKADSGQQAQHQLRQMSLHNEPVALLLIDEQMPEMNGSEFLQEARDLYPTAKRILLITYMDTRAAVQAINSGRIDYYLMKP